MKAWAKRLWDTARQRVRGVADDFSSPTATPAELNPLANDQGAALRITHINNIKITYGDPVDLDDYTVTVDVGDLVTVTAVGGYQGPVVFKYTFTDGRTSGVAQIVGEFT